MPNMPRNAPNMSHKECIKILKGLEYDVGRGDQHRVDVLLSLITQIAMRVDELSIAVGNDIRSNMPKEINKEIYNVSAAFPLGSPPFIDFLPQGGPVIWPKK